MGQLGSQNIARHTAATDRLYNRLLQNAPNECDLFVGKRATIGKLHRRQRTQHQRWHSVFTAGARIGVGLIGGAIKMRLTKLRVQCLCQFVVFGNFLKIKPLPIEPVNSLGSGLILRKILECKRQKMVTGICRTPNGKVRRIVH